MPTGSAAGILAHARVGVGFKELSVVFFPDLIINPGICAAVLHPVIGAASGIPKIQGILIHPAVLHHVVGAATGLFPVPLASSYAGSETVITTGLLLQRSLSGAYAGLLTCAGILDRKRSLFGAYFGHLLTRAGLSLRPVNPSVFHVSITKSEILLIATIGGEQNIPTETYAWSFKTVNGSGREVLLTPTGHNTRFINLIPYGYYVVQCTINNGEGVTLSRTFTVLVDTP